MSTKDEQSTTTLYYYCTLDTFVSIIKNKSIRLNEIGKSNDALEQKFLAAEIVKNLNEYVKKVVIEKMNDEQVEIISNKILRDISQEQPEPVWAICFSKKGDNLSQWRGYGDNAAGICIGFDYEYLNYINKLNEPFECDKSRFDFMRLRNIEYGETATKKYFSRLDDLNTIFKHDYQLEERLKEVISGLYTRPYYKHDAFKDEEEWRIVYSMISHKKGYKFQFDDLNKILNQDEKFKIIGKNYDVRNGYIKSYIELSISNLLKAINVIYIGSKSKVTMKDIKFFLTDEIGYKNEFEIKNSQANSYR